MLTLVATPIGNLSDISYRAVEALNGADVIYCEDTRHSLQLLNHLEIKKTLISCHEHNEKSRVREVMDRVRNGQEVVYISDAGMPGISDPGAVLVSAFAEENLPYTVIPGASAVLTAAVLSGFPCGTFSFFGFLPRDNKERKEIMDRICACGQLAILYESPHRVGATFALLKERLGGQVRAALLRELTKKYETAVRGTLEELTDRFSEEEPRGECVITVCCQDVQKPEVTDPDLEIEKMLKKGYSAKDIAAQISAESGISKKQIYAKVLEKKERK